MPADGDKPAAEAKPVPHVEAPAITRVDHELPDGRYLLSYSRPAEPRDVDA